MAYDLSRHATAPLSGVVRDRSGNGYDARVAHGVLHTPLGSKGHNYTLLVRAQLGTSAGSLLAGPDDSFGVVTRPDGRMTLAFTSSNITYPLANFTLSPRNDATEIVLTGTEAGTSVDVDGVYAGEFLVSIDGTSVLVPMAFVAPLQTIGGTKFGIEKFTLWDGIQDASGIASEGG